MPRRRLSDAHIGVLGVLALIGLTGMALNAAGAGLPAWVRVGAALAVLIVAIDGTIEGLAELARRAWWKRTPRP